ncbi:peptidase S8 and S53, subtilisin, kexin, sedolisin [[Actinomadura] parvosata subsp. kistnae]|uniref:Peptidase S8/S53 domain-containing protein n=1 Tax=[Actinomadura] parvosata subsp. kistnae TaxID=1909395 RepID=A0A1U9ZUU7_9ACTN|nr:S8 family serine peptidase [Nonomuraea sp. ATCC 55076]AQZ61718.1 hypothetical protein BKM31_09750 [Nonomuraea sp. ATCC 55076]SPL87828.1 peptidase S8 and S53, subtilisin, kexin, sedolisin [Actinomadura parvosata subsp. kistnae]
MSVHISVSVPAGALITRDTEITVSCDEAIDARSAQGAIGIRGRRVRVEVTADGRTALVRPDGELPHGRHRLVVGELLSTQGHRLTEPFDVPFTVIDRPLELGARLRVDGHARVVLGEVGTTRVPLGTRPDGPFLDLVKATDEETGEPVELAFDENGRRVEAEAVLGEVSRRYAERHGRIHETLGERLRRARDDERIPVAIWARLPEDTPRFDKDPERAADEPGPEERRLGEQVARVTRHLRDLVAHAFDDHRAVTDPVAPVVYATMTRDRITDLAGRDEVAALFPHEREGRDDLGDSMKAARSDLAQQNLSLTGRGVRVAVWESGPDDVKDLDIAGSFTATPSTSTHARLTHAVVKNVEADRPHGHAPGCELFSANDYGLEALRWAVRDQGCTVVSQSFHRASEPGSAVLSFDDVYKDWLALHWPYPTIVQAAGNYWEGDADDIHPPEDEYVNHKGYNGLTVGNHDDTAGAMSGDSVFRNPSAPHADRELPELAANGVGVSAVGTTMSGTSLAAPAVAGCVALIQQADAVLRSWPEGCRAIMLAAAGRNPGGSDWQSDLAAHVDASDGSGALDGQEAALIARSRQVRDSSGARRGWDVGTLRSSDIGGDRMATFVHRVSVPRRMLAPRVKVALAWDSSVLELPLFGLPIVSFLAVDLDLIVRAPGGGWVASSGSWDNSYEIAEFAAAPGQTYEIVVRRWSGTADTWYGIAWTVSGL